MNGEFNCIIIDDPNTLQCAMDNHNKDKDIIIFFDKLCVIENHDKSANDNLHKLLHEDYNLLLVAQNSGAVTNHITYCLCMGSLTPQMIKYLTADDAISNKIHDHYPPKDVMLCIRLVGMTLDPICQHQVHNFLDKQFYYNQYGTIHTEGCSWDKVYDIRHQIINIEKCNITNLEIFMNYFFMISAKYPVLLFCFRHNDAENIDIQNTVSILAAKEHLLLCHIIHDNLQITISNTEFTKLYMSISDNVVLYDLGKSLDHFLLKGENAKIDLPIEIEKYLQIISHDSERYELIADYYSMSLFNQAVHFGLKYNVPYLIFVQNHFEQKHWFYLSFSDDLKFLKLHNNNFKKIPNYIKDIANYTPPSYYNTNKAYFWRDSHKEADNRYYPDFINRDNLDSFDNLVIHEQYEPHLDLLISYPKLVCKLLLSGRMISYPLGHKHYTSVQIGDTEYMPSYFVLAMLDNMKNFTEIITPLFTLWQLDFPGKDDLFPIIIDFLMPCNKDWIQKAQKLFVHIYGDITENALPLDAPE